MMASMIASPPDDVPPRPNRRRNPGHQMARQRVSQAVWAIRQRLDLTQEELAARWQVSQASLSRWEAGTQLPSGPDLIRIAQEAAIPVAVLTGGDAGAPGFVANLAVLHAIGGQIADGYTIMLPTRFVRPNAVGVEIMDASASQVCPEGGLLLCEPHRMPIEPQDITVVELDGAMRLARALPADEPGSGVAWMGLGETPKTMAPLGGAWRPALRPYGIIGAFSPRVGVIGRPTR